MIRLELTPLQAECLLQLAQEADPATFDGNAFPRRCMQAGEAAMDKVLQASRTEREMGRRLKRWRVRGMKGLREGLMNPAGEAGGVHALQQSPCEG